MFPLREQDQRSGNVGPSTKPNSAKKQRLAAAEKNAGNEPDKDQPQPLNERELSDTAVPPGRVNKKKTNSDELLELARQLSTPPPDSKAMIDAEIEKFASTFAIPTQDDVDVALEAVGRRMKRSLNPDECDELIFDINKLVHDFIKKVMANRRPNVNNTSSSSAAAPPPPQYNVTNENGKSFLQPNPVVVQPVTNRVERSFLEELNSDDAGDIDANYMFGPGSGLSSDEVIHPQEQPTEREIGFKKM